MITVLLSRLSATVARCIRVQRADSWVVGLVAAVAAPLIAYRVTESTWNVTISHPEPGRASSFFAAQATSILEGRLDVPASRLPDECYLRDGKCFGYYGLTPSLIRLPFSLHAPDVSSYDAAFLTAALVLTSLLLMFVGLAIWRWVCDSTVGQSDTGLNKSVLWLLIFCIGVGLSPALIILGRVAVYEEAASWCAAFSVATTVTVIMWFRSRSEWWLWVSALLGILAANARPTGALLAFGLGIVVVLTAAVSVRAWRSAIGVLVAASVLAVAPGATALTVYQVKFGTPTPSLTLNEQVPENPAWQRILDANGAKDFSASFVPTQLVALLRPDSPHVAPTSPGGVAWSRIAVVPPAVDGGMYLESSASGIALVPLAVVGGGLLAFVVIPAFLARRLFLSVTMHAIVLGPEDRRRAGVFFGLLPVGTSAGVVLVLVNVAVANRYVADLLPVMATLAAGVLLAAPLIMRGRNVVRWVVLGGALGAAADSLALAVLLARGGA